MGKRLRPNPDNQTRGGAALLLLTPPPSTGLNARTTPQMPSFASRPHALSHHRPVFAGQLLVLLRSFPKIRSSLTQRRDML